MTKWLLLGALALGVIGGALAFAIHPSDASAGPFDLKAVGGVILAAAALLAAGAAISGGVNVCRKPADKGKPSSGAAPSETTGTLHLDPESLRTITGLVAVVTAIVAVAVLTVIAINLLGGGDGKESTVAITTSAFGIVSAVVSAYLGIKATVNASDKALRVALGEQNEKKGDETHCPPARGGRA